MSEEKSGDGVDNGSATMIETELTNAAFSKLPSLGPIVWLYGRTPDRRFFFLSDLDWIIMPSLILNQCRIFLKGKMPFAFVNWAFVDDDINQRFLEGNSKLQPHQWRSGQHMWLVDVVTPFGSLKEVLTDVQKLDFPGKTLKYLSRNQSVNTVTVNEFKGVFE